MDPIGSSRTAARCNAGCGTHSIAEEPVSDQCDWAGLPVNLDFAFSRDQRDKVYKQHLLRMRGTQFGPWRHGVHVCVCEIAEEHDGARTLPITSDFESLP